MSTSPEQQKMLRRLSKFRAAIGEEFDLLDRALQAQVNERVKRLGRPVRVAIAGPGVADHHGLCEFLLGVNLFARTERETAPLIRVLYGDKSQTVIHTASGDQVLGALRTHGLDGIEGLESVTLCVPLPIAQRIGFTIMPTYDGTYDRTRFLGELAEDNDIVVWATGASSPWSAQERRFWFTIPEELKRRSILAVCCDEPLDSTASQGAVDVTRDVAGHEVTVLSGICVADAKAAAPKGRVVDDEAFAASGGRALLGSLMGLVKQDQDELLSGTRDLLDELNKIPLGRTQAPPPMPAPAPVEKAPDDPLRALIVNSANRCESALKLCSDDFAPMFAEIASALEDYARFAASSARRFADPDALAARIDEALELAMLLGHENTESAARDAVDLLAQISDDLLTHDRSRTDDALPLATAV